MLGKVFWLGRLERIGGVTGSEAEAALHRLERKEFVRRERRHPSQSESEYVFVTCSSGTWRTARSRGRGGRRSTGSPASGSSRSAGPRITPRCSRTTT